MNTEPRRDDFAVVPRAVPDELEERLALAERVLRETPVVALEDEQVELYAKLEFLNGVGSVKDRSAFWILKGAIERREITPQTTVVESSSGNLACALAVFCRLLGLRFIPVVDPLISPLYEAFLTASGAELVKVDKRDDTGGFLKTRLARVQQLCASLPHAYWPDQYGNADALSAHAELTGGEIIRQLDAVDYVFIGVSSAGTIAGVSQRLKAFRSSVRIVAVDAEGSVIFGQRPRPRRIPGLGSSISPPLVKEALIDDVIFVSERDTVDGCYELLRRHRLFVGGSSGAAYSAIKQYFSNRTVAVRPRVLFLCCDRGTAYLHNIFNPEWCQSLETGLSGS